MGLRRVEGRAAGEAAGGCASRLVHAENWDRANENGSRATFIEIIVNSSLSFIFPLILFFQDCDAHFPTTEVDVIIKPP